MNSAVTQAIESIQLLSPQSYRHFTIVPLRTGRVDGPAYLGMSEAFALGVLEVREVSAAGSVPEVFVENWGELPVLVLDGEELVGAKQNRVVNTTILLRERGSTVIPVSCTERGRWGHVSPGFRDSDEIMARKARGRKSMSVSESLRRRRSYASNQGEVWDEVQVLHEELGVRSPSGAMRDAYEARRDTFADILDAFPCLEGQCGLVVFSGGAALGMDYVSRPEAYRAVHAKLVRSYTIDSLDAPYARHNGASREAARAFLRRMPGLYESAFPSVGYGEDYRYDGGSMWGSALVHEGACVHAACFAAEAKAAPRRPRPEEVARREAARREREARHYAQIEEDRRRAHEALEAKRAAREQRLREIEAMPPVERWAAVIDFGDLAPGQYRAEWITQTEGQLGQIPPKVRRRLIRRLRSRATGPFAEFRERLIALEQGETSE